MSILSLNICTHATRRSVYQMLMVLGTGYKNSLRTPAAVRETFVIQSNVFIQANANSEIHTCFQLRILAEQPPKSPWVCADKAQRGTSALRAGSVRLGTNVSPPPFAGKNSELQYESHNKSNLLDLAEKEITDDKALIKLDKPQN